MSWNKLVNTRYFSEAAIDFTRNGGRYTLAPPGSREYREYWELQEERCMNGYKVGDTWITGRHYDFLNFTPIMKIPDLNLKAFLKEQRDKTGTLSMRTMPKVLEFPRFYEVGYEWYRYKHIAWNGGRFRAVISPGGKHVVVAKARGAGFSYMEAQDGVYNFKFLPGSKNYYFASTEQYLTTDGILNKVRDMLNWTNANIPQWSQNRMEHDTLMHMKASYLDAFGHPRGNMSEIIGTIVDNANKVRGKRGRKIVFEEAGSFKNLKKAVAIARKTIEDGSFITGQMTIFGTGGEEGPSIEGLEEIFDQPELYNCLAFLNEWDEEQYGNTCGFFVPITMVDPMFMDEDGNPDLEAATAEQQIQRDLKAKAKDPKELDLLKAEQPLYPKEVFSRLARNPFRKSECDRQINYILKSAAIQELLRYGELVDGEGGLEFAIKTKEEAQPVDDYPHTQRKDDEQKSLEGCITVVERPHLDALGHTPEGVYQLVFDPFYKEESEDLTSLFDCTVWKQYNAVSPYNENLPIAWYTGRPKNIDDAYDRLFKLARWYNCKIQGEIAGGGQGVLDYAKRHHLLHMLDFELELTENKEVTEKKNRSYLMNMPTEKKRMGLTYLINWHMDQRGLREDGTPIYNIHKVYKLGLLREMSKFDGKRNADRISSSIVAMFSLKEKIAKKIEQERTIDDDYYNRELYGETSRYEEKEFVTLDP